MPDDKLPPHNVDAEEAVIGALLIDPEAIWPVSDILKPEHFYREKNAWAYEACLALWDKHVPIDQITLANEIAQRGRIEALGGASYLSHLVSLVPTSVDVEYYAYIVLTCWKRRQLISVGQEITRLGYDMEWDIALEQAQNILNHVENNGAKDGPQSLIQIMDAYMPTLTEYVNDKEKTRGVPTGFRGIDNSIEGIAGLTLLGGRPSQGKTELSLAIVSNLARWGKSSLIFSADASKWVVAQRLISSEAENSIKKVKYAPEGTERDILEAALWKAFESLKQRAHLIGVDDIPRLSRSRIEGHLQRWEAEHGKPSLIVFDYVELYAQRGEGEERISRVVEDFRDIGRIHEIPVLALSQLNREIEKRDIPRPQLSDLRYSGMLEQAADAVLLMWWPYFYRQRRDKLAKVPEDFVEILIAKNKEGPANNRIGIHFSPRQGKMKDWPEERLPMIG